MIEQDYPYRSSLNSGSTTEVSESMVTQDAFDTIRKNEYPQLEDKIYLDHAGTTLYAKSLIEAFSTDMMNNLYGNPHSESSPSAYAGKKVDVVREQALRFFHADPAEWDLIFVANATAAIKLAVECFRDYADTTKKERFWYGYHKDAHTSLVAGRTMSHEHRCFRSDEEVEQWIEGGCNNRKQGRRQLELFAFPGQSNMTGRRLPLEWNTMYTLLDAAALATTAPLHLENCHSSPDMVALSFYKIFGFPNLGALLVQKRCKDILQRKRYFGGGTVEMVIAVDDTWHAKKHTSIHDQLEDGTLPFHSIFALGHAMRIHEALYGPNPMLRISERTAILTRSLYQKLSQLRHQNGRQMIQFYNEKKVEYGNARTQGATIAFNILRSDGSMVGYSDVEKQADKLNIYVRSGSLCNPGGIATHLKWSPQQMRRAYAEGHRCSKPIQSVLGKPTGVVRASLGAMSTQTDVDIFVEFVKSTYCELTCEFNETLMEKRQSIVEICIISTQPVQLPGPLSRLRRFVSCLRF